MCADLGISHYVIFDTDTGNQSSANETKKITDALGNDTAKYSAMPNTLEDALGLTKQNRQNWRQILTLLEPISYDDMQTQFPDFVGAAKSFIDDVCGIVPEETPKAA